MSETLSIHDEKNSTSTSSAHVAVSLDDDVKASSALSLDDDISTLTAGANKLKLHVSSADPSNQLTLQKALGTLIGRDKFADLEVTVGQGAEKMTILAHRLVLGSASDVFSTMLYGNKSSSTSTSTSSSSSEEIVYTPKNKQKISLPDMSPSMFYTILQCVYSDRVHIDAEILPQLIIVARTYNIEVLRQACITFMAEGVTPANACKLYQRAYELLNDNSFALEYIRTHAADVFESKGFEDLSEERLIELLKDDRLMISEAKVFQAVLRWASCRCLEAKQVISPQNVAEVLKNILPHVRFHTMTAQEIALVVAPSRLVPPSQILELFTYIAQSAAMRQNAPALFSKPIRLGGMPLTWGFSRRFATLGCEIKSAHSQQMANDTLITSNLVSGVYNHAHGSAVLQGIACWRVSLQTQNDVVYFGIAANRRYPDYSASSPGVYLFSTTGATSVNGVAAQSGISITGKEFDLCYHPTQKKLYMSVVQTGGKSTASIKIVSDDEFVAHVCVGGTAGVTIQPIPMSKFVARHAIN